MTPTRWVGAALGAIGLLAALLPGSVPVAVVVVTALVVVGVTLGELPALRKRPRATRQVSRSMVRGQRTHFALELKPVGARSVELRQPLPPDLLLDISQVRGTKLVGTLLARRRGRHVIAPAVARFSGHLGLARVDRRVGESVTIDVFPDLPGARRLLAVRRRGRSVEEGRIRRHLGVGTEFETIRDYSPDDDVRQINWIATSRAGRPMSNQYRVEENRDLICLVDAGRLMAAPVTGLDAEDEPTRLDVALDALCALAVAADDAGDRVGAIAFRERILLSYPPRRRGAQWVVQALYDLEPEEVDSAYELAFQAVAGRKRSFVALFTDVMDEAATRSMLEAMPVLVRHHALMVVTCADDDLIGMARAAPSELLDLHRATVAIELLAGRTESIRRLRAFGAVVVDAPPRSLGPAVVRGYMEQKQRGAI